MQKRVLEERPGRQGALNSIADDFKGRLFKYGQPILIRQVVKSKRCHCWNITTRTVNPDCVSCLGGGFPFIESLEMAIIERTSNVQATSLLDISGEPGPIPVPFSRFVLRGEVMPKVEDQLIEIDFDDISLYKQIIDEYQVKGRSRFSQGIFQDASAGAIGMIRGNVWSLSVVTPVRYGRILISWETFGRRESRS
jgi:hypothetical protein